jgi:hypothetical protein
LYSAAEFGRKLEQRPRALCPTLKHRSKEKQKKKKKKKKIKLVAVLPCSADVTGS